VSIPTAFFVHAGRDPVGVLRALALSQGGVRRVGEAVLDEHQGPDVARMPDAVSAGGADDPVRRLSKPVLDMSAASVQQLVNNYASAVTAVKAAALLP